MTEQPTDLECTIEVDVPWPLRHPGHKTLDSERSIEVIAAELSRQLANVRAVAWWQKAQRSGRILTVDNITPTNE